LWENGFGAVFAQLFGRDTALAGRAGRWSTSLPSTAKS